MNNPDVAAADLHLIAQSGLFDSDWYLDRNPDVCAAGVNALAHYLQHGAAEGRDPNPLFDSDWYLHRYPDVRAAGMNPLAHYIRYGAAERRDPSASFSTQYYLVNNPDVAAAGLNPLVHYLRHGAIEGRSTQRSDSILRDLLLQSEYQHRIAVSRGKRDVAYSSIAVGEVNRRPDTFKPIAFYLPQMHPIPENDRAWGRGFTEWTNVSKAIPQFGDHYQPKLPGELGFYDLRQPDVMYRQIELAKLYGLYAFCFHYYWFNGRRLLERPLDMFLADRGMDFNFCLCWANENWTKQWDGLDHEVLITQQHSKKDHEAIFEDLLRYMLDDRYVCIDGRPVIVVYRPGIISEVKALVQIWRQKATEAGLSGIYLVATNSFGFQSPKEFGFDAICEFPPHGLNVDCVDTTESRLNRDYSGFVYRYEDVLAAELKKLESPPSDDLSRFPGVMPAWDNEARRPGQGNVFHGSTPALFHAWLTGAAVHVSRYYAAEKRFVFINAWNEWAEGAYLEPDRRFGYAYLAAVRNVVQKFNVWPEPLQKLAAAYNGRSQSNASDTVVCLHIFYPSLISEFAESVAQAKRARQMDVIVTIPDSWTEQDCVSMMKDLQPKHVLVTKNIGRDIWPFVQALKVGLGMGYKFGCKLHSKMSTHRNDGGAWRRSLVDSVVSPASIERLGPLFFDQPRFGFAAMEQSFHTLHDPDTVLHNLENMKAVMSRLGVTQPDFQEFVAGSMFWFRLEAFQGLAGIDASWFDEELGQIDGTTAHAFERIFASYVCAMGWKLAKY
jgi:lipopolysaccharide biosynthesis protein